METELVIPPIVLSMLFAIIALDNLNRFTVEKISPLLGKFFAWFVAAMVYLLISLRSNEPHTMWSFASSIAWLTISLTEIAYRLAKRGYK